jgi:iron complex transport system substrate-binding protein
MKAQFADWGANFHDRARNKRVVVLSGVAPLEAAGLWVSDLIRLISATPLVPSGEPYRPLDWRELVAFRPDVIVVSPVGFTLREAMRSFPSLEQHGGWEGLPAVKRGEVFFLDGDHHLHLPGLSLRESMGILVSAFAGIDSGYITPRDSYHRLRWLELHRHTLG